MIERLRAELQARVPADYKVTEKRTQYWMDEDSAAFCEIAVSGGDREFALVVCRGFVDDLRYNEFFARVWLRYSPEVWIVDEEAQRVWGATQAAPSLAELTDELVPFAVEGVSITGRLVFGNV